MNNTETNTSALSVIDAEMYSKMLFGGASMLSQHAAEVNDLNVFPVPDGDTGTNMAKTFDGGLTEISKDDSCGIGDLMHKFSHGALLGARGNSGVILSQIFAGISEALESCVRADAATLSAAYKNGVDKAYRAVKNPTEGTILTVFRESCEYADKNLTEDSTVEDFFRLHTEAAKRSLENTPNLLPVLREAEVVDSGGAGYFYIALGMYLSLCGKIDGDYRISAKGEDHKAVDIDLFTRDSVLEFGYCTEFLLRLMTAKVDPDTFEVSTVTNMLEALGGDSVVAYKTDDVIKVHVHTFEPGRILNEMQRFGEFLTVKIENMSLGHTEQNPKESEKKPKKIATLAVATGEGLKALFTHLGADGIIEGGQTLNPSTEDFIEAFEGCNAENIILFPNNKNVLLAATQASEIYGKAKIHIINSLTPMQCYSALSVLTTDGMDVDSLVKSLNRVVAETVSCEVTRSIRSVTLNGVHINKGDYISITDGEISSVADSAEDAVLGMLEKIDTDDYEILTFFVGTEVEYEKRDALIERIEETYPDLEVAVYESGLEMYDYLISIE